MKHDFPQGMVRLFDPEDPDLWESPAVPFLVISDAEVFTHANERSLLKGLGQYALMAFRILQKGWEILGKRLADFKIEGGLDYMRRLRLADVIDNDSWRLKDAEGDMSKQAYRDDGPLNEVLEKYRAVAALTRRFHDADIRQAAMAIAAGWEIQR